MADLAALIEASPVAAALRASRWSYPAVNAAHVLGLALLVGAATPMALRLMGLWRDVPLRDVLRLLRPVAATGAALAVLSGALLFSVQATDYAGLQLFWVKLALVATGLAHALLAGRRIAAASPSRRRVAGMTSLSVWVAVLICGRMLGYV